MTNNKIICGVDASSAKIKTTWTSFIIVILHNIKVKVMEKHGNRPKKCVVHYGLKRSDQKMTRITP